MAAFFDNQGEWWNVEPDGPTLRRIRDTTTVDVTIFGKEAWQQLKRDIVVSVQILYLVCQKQCDVRGVTYDQFADGLDPKEDNPRLKGIDALEVAMENFFRQWTRKVKAAARVILNFQIGLSILISCVVRSALAGKAKR